MDVLFNGPPSAFFLESYWINGLGPSSTINLGICWALLRKKMCIYFYTTIKEKKGEVWCNVTFVHQYYHVRYTYILKMQVSKCHLYQL